MRTLLNKIRKLLKDRRTRRLWSRTISIVAALVVFVTTYALVLPAITMERQAYCGLEAHQHTDECFERRLICTIPESPGHHHDDSCYTMRQEYSCTLEEHIHAEGCYDEEGNLICKIPEHTHEEGTCWQEVPELTCTLEESDGHQHGDSCYENVLVCGKEVHTHSEACYENPDEFLETAAVATTQEGAYGISTFEDFDGAGTDAGGDSDGAGDEIGWTDSDDYGNAARNDDPSTGLSDPDNAANSINAAGSDAAELDAAGADASGSDAAGTDTLSEEAQQDLTSAGINEEEDRYVPQLDPLFFNEVLNKHTGIYYYHVQEGETIEDSSLITEWKKVDKTAELGPDDLLRVYLSYTIPAGSLNETNPTASYRLPANLHLTDDQVNGINAVENGIAAAYIDYDTLTVTDPDNYHRYLGAEAVEGTRTPDQTLEDYLAQTGGGAGTSNSGGTGDGNAAGQEFISATVRAQNVYDNEGLYGEKGAYLGQDLIFTFSPYTIEKNQHTYDASGQPTRAGEKVRGWFAIDFNLSQVDLDEPYIEEIKNIEKVEVESNNDRENENADEYTGEENTAVSEDGAETTVLISRELRTADIVFVEKDDSRNLDEISTAIKVVTAENYERAEENPDDTENIGNTENSEENGEEQPEESAEDSAENLTGQEAETGEDTTDADSEDKSDADAEDKKDVEQTAEDDKDKDKTGSQDEEPEKTIMPAMSFEDSIRVRTGKPAGVEDGSAGSAAASAAESLPRKAKVTVRVEADEGTFPAGTIMALSAVEDLDAVAETVKETVENGDGDNNGNTTADTENKNPKTYGFQAVDISFRDADGNEIEPAKPVRVALTSEIVEQIKADKEANENSSIADPVVVHLDDDGNAEKMDLIAPEEVEPAQGKTEEELREEQEKAKAEKEEAEKAGQEEPDLTAPDDGISNPDQTTLDNQENAVSEMNDENPAPEDPANTGQSSSEADDQEKAISNDQQPAGGDAPNESGEEPTVFFQTDSFSVYAIVYTVDFHYEVNGKEYEFSLPGGGFVSLQQLVEVLGIAGNEAGNEAGSEADSENVSNDADNSDVFFTENNINSTEEESDTEDSPASTDGEDAQSESSQNTDPQANTMLTLADVVISDQTRAFLADIEKVEFSNPELVWVGKADAETTVSGLKDANGLDCEYSAALAEEHIAKINNSKVEAGDWALISMRPFDTEESLTVTMKNGDQFVIKVTDAQISTGVLTADGKTFVITVTFDPIAAQIPAGTKLVAEEIEPGSDEYYQYMGRTWAEVNKEYLKQREQINEGTLNEDDIEDIRPVNLDESRFFNVSFVFNDEEIEPKAPVQVDIQLAEGLSNSADAPISGIVHFPKIEDPEGKKTDKTEIELIDNLKNQEDENGNFAEYSCELDSFSVMGAYLGQKTVEYGFSAQDPAVTLPKLSALRAGDSTPALRDLTASKTLTPNTLDEDEDQTDGTYTLSLSVKGDAVESEKLSKTNVLIVMDRSTSMNRQVEGAGVPFTGTYDPNKTYYGIVDDKIYTLNHNNQTDTWTYTAVEDDPTTWWNETETAVYEGRVYVQGSRLNAEQAALEELVSALTEKNTAKNPEAVEVSVLSFASERGKNLQGIAAMGVSGSPVWSGVTETGWKTTYGTDDDLYKAVHNNSMNNGTNWEDALLYAKEVADAKKALQPDEDVYIIFLTDGMPTAINGEKCKTDGYGAHHYTNHTNFGDVKIGGGNEIAYYFARDGSTRTDFTAATGGFDWNDNQGEFTQSQIDAIIAARNAEGTGAIPYPARQIVNAGYKLYNIFTFNKEEEEVGYLRRLTNFAYGNGDIAADTLETDTYYTAATDIATLKKSFDNIFKAINDTLGHGDVKIVDGLTTDSMTTNIVDGQADGIRYKVEDENGDVAYTVTASGSISDPTVKFEINGENYTYDPTSGNNTVQKVTRFTDSTEETDEATGAITRTDVTTTVTVGGGKTTVATNTVVWTSTDNGETFVITNSSASTPVVNDGENNAGMTIPEDAKTYYSVILGGTAAVEYRMALADTVTDDKGTEDEADDERTLTWDLSPIGILKKDYTYTMELVVWPNQDAYDYVAGLNNFPDVEDDEFEWDDERAIRVEDPDTHELLYYKGGVAQFPSIVKYPDGTFSVLSNTDQHVYYSDVHAQSTNDVITSEDKTPHDWPLDTPPPMPLEFTDTFLEKEWSADRNPALLAQVLYKLNGNDMSSTGFQAVFDIYKGDAYKTDENAVSYKTVELGWVNDLDDNGHIIYLNEGEAGEYVLEKDPETGELTGNKIKGHYVWDDTSLKTVNYSGHQVQIGTRWASKFAIATGLMLSSEEHVRKLGLDPAKYATATYEGTTYYILEPGHDYYVEEQAELGYEFDFIAPVFHPMLVDGQLMNVVFKDGFAERKITPDDHFTITGITEAPGGSGNLKVENKLRAYINIEKRVVDTDGVTAVHDDDTKFTYKIDLVSPLDPGPFEGTHIPWYGINGLFYHTEEESGEVDPTTGEAIPAFTYYQAELPNTDLHQSHTLTLTTESGEVYQAVCTDKDGNEYDDEGQPYIFDKDVPGPTYVTYSYEIEAENDGENEGEDNGEDEGEDEEPVIITVTKTLLLYGNQMDRALVTNEGTGEQEESANHVSVEFQIKQSQRLSLANIPQETTYTITELPESGYELVNIRKEILNGKVVESRRVYTDSDTIADIVVPDRDNNLIFTNKKLSTDITVKKVDQNNKPLSGAVFTLTKSGGDQVVKPAAGEDDTGIYKFSDLEDGSYTLVETSAPEGYAKIGAGTANEGTVATFTVSNGKITGNVNRPNPDDVQWDGETLTFTVKNHELTEPGSITVRKQWLDSEGEPDAAGAESVNVLLKRRVEKSQPKLTIIAIAQGRPNNSNRTSRLEKTITIANSSFRVSWPDNGEYQWVANRLTYSITGGGSSSIEVQDGIGTNNHGNPSQHGNNYNAILTLSNLQTVTQDVTITFTYRSGYNNDNYLNSSAIFNAMDSGEITLTPIGSEIQTDVEIVEDSNWTDVTLTLNAANHWGITKTIGGTDSSHTGYDYPATDNNGNKYYYYIVEETPQGSDSLPGYEPPVYSNNNDPGISQDENGNIHGILTATNKKTERGSLAIEKLVTIAGTSGSGDMSPANGRYNFTVEDGAGNVLKHVQIRIYNGAASYKVSNTEISYDDNAGFKWVYAEGAIVDDLLPGTYIVRETTHQLDAQETPGYDMELINVEVNGDNTFDLDTCTATLTVTTGDVPKATTSYTNMLTPLTNIPLKKTWSWSAADQTRFNEKQIDSWSAKFYLQYREEYVSGEPDDPQNVQSLWGYVLEEGSSTQKKQIIVNEQYDPSIQENIAITGTKTFENLPIYKRHANGSIYRLKYAVDEVEYTIHYTDDSSTTWKKDDPDNDLFGEHYSPAYDEDANQAGESISVTNAPSTMREQKTISLGLQKLWETEDGTVTTDMPDDSYYARFKLKRYYHEEYLELENAGNIEFVKITLDLGNENSTVLEVPKGSPVYFTADLTPDEDTSITLNFRRVTQGETPETCILKYPYDNHYASTDEVVRFIVSDPINPAPQEDETWVFDPESSSSLEMINQYVLGGINGVRLATFDHENGSSHGNNNNFPYDVTGEIYDEVYNDNDGFELNSENNWAKNWDKLPQIVEKLTTVGNTTYLTSIVYSYYFEEIECNPPEYYAVFRDQNNAGVRYGDELSRVEVSGLTIDAINKPNPDTILYKVDEKDIEQINLEEYLLSGAQLKVVKYTTDEFQLIDGSWGDHGEKAATLIDTNTDGKFAVDGLVLGFYQIEETDFPDGYIQTDEKLRFEVVVDPQSEKLVIEPLAGNDAVRIINNYNNTGDNVIVYGNTPGAALPNSGGPGTRLFTILGSILILGAGVLLWRRRRLI